jgi:hypothetical protein
MSETVTLSAKFKIRIPEALCETRGWKVGQVFVLKPKGTGILLVPVSRADTLAGIAKGADATDYRDRLDRF